MKSQCLQWSTIINDEQEENFDVSDFDVAHGVTSYQQRGDVVLFRSGTIFSFVVVTTVRFRRFCLTVSKGSIVNPQLSGDGTSSPL